HVWCEEDDVVLASDTVAALHSALSGPRALLLPSPRPVRDAFTGEHLGDAVQRIDLEISAPETRVFTCF
nr:hypothetical protein [Phycisphaerae bacterium]